MCQRLFDNFSTIPMDCKNLPPSARCVFYVNSLLFAPIFRLSMPAYVCLYWCSFLCVLAFFTRFRAAPKSMHDFFTLACCKSWQSSVWAAEWSGNQKGMAGAMGGVCLGAWAFWLVLNNHGRCWPLRLCCRLFALVLVICVLCWSTVVFLSVRCCAFGLLPPGEYLLKLLFLYPARVWRWPFPHLITFKCAVKLNLLNVDFWTSKRPLSSISAQVAEYLNTQIEIASASFSDC